MSTCFNAAAWRMMSRASLVADVVERFLVLDRAEVAFDFGEAYLQLVLKLFVPRDDVEFVLVTERLDERASDRS
jgi:hypothetical protein